MFQISDISFCYLQIPFNEQFRHAAASRAQSESVWVTIKTKQGVTGYGEGCPRHYVGGETLQSAADFIDVIKDDVLASIHDLDSLKLWVADNQYIIDTNPAAWSAIELALLDVIAKLGRYSIESVLNIPTDKSTFQYSAVLGNNPIEAFARQAVRYTHMGFKDYKVKLSGSLADDRNKLQLLCNMHEDAVRLRVDANNLWKSSKEVIEYVQALQIPIFAIEEPLQPNQYDELRDIASALNLKIILDESFQRLEQFDRIKDDQDHWIINLRVSKMGGLLRSLDIIKQAKAYNIPVIIGAHVGETSLLTRAGMLIAQAAEHILLAQEGAFGTYLLKHDVCESPLMFGRLGEIQISKGMLTPVGFGLSIVPENIYL